MAGEIQVTINIMTEVSVKNTAQNLPTIVILRTTHVVCSESEAALSGKFLCHVSGSEVTWKSVIINMSWRLMSGFLFDLGHFFGLMGRGGGLSRLVRKTHHKIHQIPKFLILQCRSTESGHRRSLDPGIHAAE